MSATMERLREQAEREIRGGLTAGPYRDFLLRDILGQDPTIYGADRSYDGIFREQSVFEAEAEEESGPGRPGDRLFGRSDADYDSLFAPSGDGGSFGGRAREAEAVLNHDFDHLFGG